MDTVTIHPEGIADFYQDADVMACADELDKDPDEVTNEELDNYIERTTYGQEE
jgi:hypothetical protein